MNGFFKLNNEWRKTWSHSGLAAKFTCRDIEVIQHGYTDKYTVFIFELALGDMESSHVPIYMRIVFNVLGIVL